MISTINALTVAGLRARLVDIDRASGCITADGLAGAVTAGTRAVCFVNFSGHSLRSGLATEAARSGATDNAIMDQTGHTDVRSVKRYIRRGRRFTDNVLNTIDL